MLWSDVEAVCNVTSIETCLFVWTSLWGIWPCFLKSLFNTCLLHKGSWWIVNHHLLSALWTALQMFPQLHMCMISGVQRYTFLSQKDDHLWETIWGMWKDWDFSELLRFTHLYQCNIVHHLVQTYCREDAQIIAQASSQMVYQLAQTSLEAYYSVQFFQNRRCCCFKKKLNSETLLVSYDRGVLTYLLHSLRE